MRYINTKHMFDNFRQSFLTTIVLTTLLIIGSWNSFIMADKDATINTTDEISIDGLTRSWNLVPSPALGSDYKFPVAGEIHNDILYVPGAKDKQKIAKSSGLSSQAQSSIYIPVPSGSAGSISLSVYSNSDSRFLQLYISGSEGTENQRLYSKLNAGGITADGKKGPQTFNFTSSDITTEGGKTYLHFKDNNTEMKISGFTVTLTTGEYATVSDCSPTVAASCKADAWAPGIDYVKNAPATITWTCIATSSGGDDTKLRYKWYRYPVGHPELEEEAEGTNDEATFTPDPKNIHDWMEYYCRVTEVGCSGHDDTHATGAIRVQSLVTGWIVFEG